MQQHILVTGGAGYIGSHVCKNLSAAGMIPVTLDNLSQGRPDAVRWGPLLQADLRDPLAVRSAFERWPIAAVMHFAGAIEVGRSARDPGTFYQQNVTGSLNLLGAMVASGVTALVFSSTAAVYGLPGQPLIGENHPLRPINPYGDTKLAIERALPWFGAAHGLRHVVLRYFNACGADADGDLGECHEPETHLVPLTIGAALGTRPPLTVFGDDYDTPDGTAIRDYVHVSDLAAAHVLAVRRLLDGGESLTANLGTGSGVSVRQVLKAVESAAGVPVPHRFGPRRVGDPSILVANPALATASLGWRPVHSSFANIVETALRWHRQKDVIVAPHT